MGNLSRNDKETIRRGAWMNTVNDPIPEHVKQHAANRNPLAQALMLEMAEGFEMKPGPMPEDIAQLPVKIKTPKP